MIDSKYIFADTHYYREFERLLLIEKVFDPASRRRILATGVTTGWRCLEVGAGAGSIVHWLAEVVGENGKVVAVDLDTRLITNIKLSNVEVLEADMRHISLESNSFDLIHARCVLIHIPDFQVTLSKMLQLLKPGGSIVVEEPDFAVAKVIAPQYACQSVERVNKAILQMFTSKGIDYSLGIKLPAILQKLGLQQLAVENDTPISGGGSGMATVMKMSAMQLAEKYVATGEATYQDIENYCLFTEDPNSWAIYHAIISVIAKVK